MGRVPKRSSGVGLSLYCEATPERSLAALNLMTTSPATNSSPPSARASWTAAPKQKNVRTSEVRMSERVKAEREKLKIRRTLGLLVGLWFNKMISVEKLRNLRQMPPRLVPYRGNSAAS